MKLIKPVLVLGKHRNTWTYIMHDHQYLLTDVCQRGDTLVKNNKYCNIEIKFIEVNAILWRRTKFSGRCSQDLYCLGNNLNCLYLWHFFREWVIRPVSFKTHSWSLSMCYEYSLICITVSNSTKFMNICKFLQKILTSLDYEEVLYGVCSENETKHPAEKLRM